MAAAYPFTCTSCDHTWHLMGGHYEIMAGRGVSQLIACEDCRDLTSVTVEFTTRGHSLPPKRLPDEPLPWWQRLLGMKPTPRYAEPEYVEATTETRPLICPRDPSHTIRPWTPEAPCPRCGGGPVVIGDQPSMMVD